jgi:hypothetical protein
MITGCGIGMITGCGIGMITGCGIGIISKLMIPMSFLCIIRA